MTEVETESTSKGLSSRVQFKTGHNFLMAGDKGDFSRGELCGVKQGYMRCNRHDASYFKTGVY